MRVFKPGDKVLVLFKVQTNLLKARFHGPYEIMTKVNEVDYVVKTPDRRRPTQLCHVNMIKSYYERKGVNVNVVVYQEESDCREDVVDDSCEIRSKSDVVSVRLSNLCILENLDEKLVHLDPEQIKQMEALIFKYRDLFPDVPRRTDLVFHDVDVIHARPIKQHPYRVNVK